MYKILNFALFYLAKTKEVGKEIILQILVIFRIKKKVFCRSVPYFPTYSDLNLEIPASSLQSDIIIIQGRDMSKV